MKNSMISAAVISMLVAAGALRAHHSISMFDITAPIWVKGTVVRYNRVDPHAMITLDVVLDDGQSRHWTIEGPTLARIGRMQVPLDFLEVGDVIEVCGFPVREQFARGGPAVAEDGTPVAFMHGHALVLPDGRMQSWGPYGKLDNCVRPSDSRDTWLDLLDLLEQDPLAREAWCDPRRAALPTWPGSEARVDEIKRRMTGPCG